jgi:hypothetical protein
MGTSSHTIKVAALIRCISGDELLMLHELCIMNFVMIAYMHESSDDIGWMKTEISDHKQWMSSERILIPP